MNTASMHPPCVDLTNQIAAINAMSRTEMARLIRFAPAGHPYLKPPLWAVFDARFNSLGGWSPVISKTIGWTP